MSIAVAYAQCSRLLSVGTFSTAECVELVAMMFLRRTRILQSRAAGFPRQYFQAVKMHHSAIVDETSMEGLSKQRSRTARATTRVCFSGVSPVAMYSRETFPRQVASKDISDNLPRAFQNPMLV